jgi:hypothetical protein
MIYWVAGDDGGPLDLVVTGMSESLVGATVAVQARLRETGAFTTLTGTVQDAATGTLRVSGAQRALLAAGTYLLRVRVTYASTAVDVFPAEGPEPEVVVRSAW